MINGCYSIPKPYNEPILGYAPGSKERKLIIEELNRQQNEYIEVPVIIGGEEIFTKKTVDMICPHDHKKVLGKYHRAGKKEIELAISKAMEAKEKWAQIPWQDKAAIFLRAAELITIKYRYILNAATMLNQSKNVHQAEIDSACELADFFRFNSGYMQEIYQNQPMFNPNGTWNVMDYRPLEGFVFAVTPFNFVSIAGNLPSAPALMGNTVIWKPASTAVLSAYYIMKLFKEAGLPDGVINFVPSSASEISDTIFDSDDLAGVHFTGSTGVFNWMWKRIGSNIDKYKSYPRIVGETGGKDFVFVHNSVDHMHVATALVRGAFEYQGQKCSAASRAYIPKSLWGVIKEEMGEMLADIKNYTGDPIELKNFFNAVIDEKSFDNTMSFINEAKESNEAEIVFGGNGDKTKGFFIEPTVILTENPSFITMTEEIFAPVLTIYVYDDDKFEETLQICEKTSPYGLTGAIFSNDRHAAIQARNTLRNAAGNFYINDKPTGAVVGQQPFGGARRSGTNDKAGSYLNLIRWTSPRTIKENYIPPQDYKYPFMQE